MRFFDQSRELAMSSKIIQIEPSDSKTKRMNGRKAASSLIKAIIASCFLVSTVASAQASTSLLRDDKQLWNEVQLTAPLCERADLQLGGALRVGRDMSHLVYERVSIGFAFNPSRHFTLTPSFTSRVSLCRIRRYLRTESR